MSRLITKRHIAITLPQFSMAMTFLIARVNSLGRRVLSRSGGMIKPINDQILTVKQVDDYLKVNERIIYRLTTE